MLVHHGTGDAWRNPGLGTFKKLLAAIYKQDEEEMEVLPEERECDKATRTRKFPDPRRPLSPMCDHSNTKALKIQNLVTNLKNARPNKNEWNETASRDNLWLQGRETKPLSSGAHKEKQGD